MKEQGGSGMTGEEVVGVGILVEVGERRCSRPGG